MLSASYHGIGLSMDDNGRCCPGSRYLLFALGKVNVSISVLERSNGFVGQVLVLMHRCGNNVFDALIISSGPLRSNVSLTGLSIPG